MTFNYKDYRSVDTGKTDESTNKQMSLAATEFIRRFKQHILPKRFTKIRTYGYLANRDRQQRINAVLKTMKLPLHKGLVKIPLELKIKEQFGIDILECPCCKGKTMQLVQIFYPWKHADDG